MKTKEPEHVSQMMRDLAQAVLEGQQKPRQYTGSNGYKPLTARFKMKIWYRDGNSRVYYSFDHYQKPGLVAVIDEWEGFKKLIRLGHVAHKDEVRVMVIWACLAQQPSTGLNHYDYEIFKVSKNGQKQNKCVSFQIISGNTVLDTTKLFYQSAKKLK